MENKNRKKSEPKTGPLFALWTEDVSKTLILKKTEFPLPFEYK